MINSRIKQLRKCEGLTLEQFGKRLGVKKSAVSLIENGKNGVTEQMILSICREFHVNEEWLRTGNGEMYRSLSKREVIADFMGDVLNDSDDSFRVRLIEALAQLNEEEWEMLAKVIDNISEDCKNDKQ